MKIRVTVITVWICIFLLMSVVQAAGNSERGRAFWNQEFTIKDNQRSCAICHTSDPGKPGKHQRTGKLIKPMAPAANSERLTNPKKVQKWFKRNCKWTVGRECTAQEKADVLEYLKSYQWSTR